MSCELWSINRWLRWTGFRLYVEVDMRPKAELRVADCKPTRVGIRWWGWRE